MAMVGIMGCKACTTSGGVTVELGALLIFCKSTALCTCLECCVVLKTFHLGMNVQVLGRSEDYRLTLSTRHLKRHQHTGQFFKLH